MNNLQLFIIGLVVAFTSCCNTGSKSCCHKSLVTISDTVHVDREHFKIIAGSTTYLYDKKGGGFSSIIDNEGKDWIQFKPDTAPIYPNGAANAYRGLPNFVFRGEDDGAGHPGFDKCISTVKEPDQIQSVTISGKWQWTWTFTDSMAYVTIDKSDTSRGYWFLYEGTVAGEFNPKESYWGTNEGVRYEMPNHYTGEDIVDNWKWAFFGNQNNNKVFFIAQTIKDDANDCFSYLGNTTEGLSSEDGMVVFGFGREKTTEAFLKGENTFIIGFWNNNVREEQQFKQLTEYINKLTQKF